MACELKKPVKEKNKNSIMIYNKRKAQTKFYILYFDRYDFSFSYGTRYLKLSVLDNDGEGYTMSASKEGVETGWKPTIIPLKEWEVDLSYDNVSVESKEVYEFIRQKGEHEDIKNRSNIDTFNELLKGICEIKQPPTPGGGDGQNSGGQTDNASCSNTGQFGGGGTPLKDIKLFLYANNVTKGTIKLSKPQVEVGTFATDWRPNPSDYVERNSPAYKEIKGLAIQHNQDQNKKYIEVQATDGTVYGVDLWGGDAKKLLEQQQAEIEELKKLVQTLETKINV